MARFRSREAFIEKDCEIWAARADKIHGWLGKRAIDPETLDGMVIHESILLAITSKSRKLMS
jgi:hypothetical protein